MKSFSNTAIAALIALGLTGMVAILPLLPFFGPWEAQTGDQLMKLSYQLHKKFAPLPPDPSVVFVAIDEDSVQQLGRWPFPRGVHGQFLDVLAPENPKVVGWDVFFTEPTVSSTSAIVSPAAPDGSNPPAAPASDASGSAPPPLPAAAANGPAPETINPEDQALVEGTSQLRAMVTASEATPSGALLKEGDLLPPRPFKNVTGDTSLLRSGQSARLPIEPLRKKSYFGINGLILPSLDFQILLQYWGVDPDHVVINISHEIIVSQPGGTQTHIPIDEKGCLIINYRARLNDFQNRSYFQLALDLANKIKGVKSDDRNAIPAIKDRIVVVGVVIAGTDAGVTPLEANAPNVVTRLNVLNNILQHDFIRQISPWIWLPVYAMFLFVAGNLMLRVGIAPMIPIGFLAILIVALTAFAALWFGNLQVPVAGPEFGLLVLASVIPTRRFFGEEREKRRIKNVLRVNLSEKVMIKMLAHPDNVKLGGTKQEITVMFCDIRGFTKYCDDRDPQEVLNVVNDYFEEMTQVVFKYDGTVDKYIGDCIMAFWNAPDLQPDHAQRAVCCAIEMRYALANFKTIRAGKDTELFECGIGIHTGEALVGNMGSSLKSGYTAMGSTVNMGARLEALTKRLNERILISEETYKQLQGDFPLTDRGEAMVPGFAKPIHVYAVGADQDITSALKVGRTIATQQEYTAEEVSKPIWEPAPLPEDADPNP